MDIRCPSCSKLFRVADEKIAGKGIRFKCSKCAEVITITKDDFEMDLLAREGATASPAAAPSAPAPKPAAAPTPPPPAAEPEAREYKPPVEQPDDDQPEADQQLPAASLGDFDFSEPHAAATAAAHPAEGFSGDFAFGSEQVQEQAAPEIEISPEAAAEAEAALDFPVDLISEPKRKAAFGAPAAPEPPAPAAEPASELGAGPDAADQEIDLGAALAMPTDPEPEDEPVAAERKADAGPAPSLQAGPVITPELLAQMKKNASAKPAAPAKAAASADEEMDLGAALAMPRSAGKADTKGAGARSFDASATKGGDAGSSGKRTLIIAVIAVVLAAVLGALYYLGFLWGKGDQEAQQRSQTRPRQEITPAGLHVVNAHAYFDPATGDLVVTGAVRNTLDKPKTGWYLEVEVRDAKESVLTTLKMLNGAQLYSSKDYEALAKRGVNVEELKKRAAAAVGKGEIAAQGSIDFEVRSVNPPAGSAGFLPVLRSFDTASPGPAK
jgi:predicted Zn finger-like uncharacterized protein